MRKHIFIILVLIMFGVDLPAQTRTISGTIKDAHGEPLPGVVILRTDEPSIGVVSDEKGEYKINLPESGATLKFTLLNYKDIEVQVAKKSIIDVTMEEDSFVLDETVCVGYGSMKRSDVTGALSVVNIPDKDLGTMTSLDQILEGRAAGVQVLSDNASPDSGVSVRIRGLSSFSGNTDPLYVVDGVIINGSSNTLQTMTSGTVGTSSYAIDSSNGLFGINPRDIASIEILKDASATAIYGSEGANGVVLITTKTAETNAPTINFHTDLTCSYTDKRIGLLSFDEYVDMLAHSTSTSASKQLHSIYDDYTTRTGLRVTPVDWQDYIFRPAFSQNYYLSIAGKPKNINYMFSLGYNSLQGVIKQSDSQNLTAKLNLSSQLSKSVKLDFRMNFGYTFSNLITETVNGGNISSRSSLLRSTMRSRPYIMNDNDEYAIIDVSDADYEDHNFGPSRWLEGSTNTSRRFRINPSLSLEWKITKWLSFKSLVGADASTNTRIKTKDAKLTAGDGNMSGLADGYYLRYNFDNVFNFWVNKGAHSFNAALGQSLSAYNSEEYGISGWLLPQKNAGIAGINNATPEASAYEMYSVAKNSQLSFFCRANYTLKDRYLFTGTVRWDGSSKFKGVNKWGIFPSFSFAWKLNNEPWFKVPCINVAKIRAGWGQVGNQRVGNYLTTQIYYRDFLGNHNSESEKVIGSYPNNIVNENLKWETSNQFNVGLDLSMWKGRLTLTVDAYQKDTKDLLQYKSLPLSTGYSTIAINDGSIRNRGIEFTLEGVPLSSNGFELKLGGNLAINRNTITSVGKSGSSSPIYLSRYDSAPTNVNYFYGDSISPSPINIFIEGQQMGLFYGYVFDGIVQTGETAPGFTEGVQRGPGYSKYLDLDGNGYLDDRDKTIIGNPMPKFTYGFHANFDYRNLSFRIDFLGAYDFDIFNLNNVQDYRNTPDKNMRKDAYFKAWTPENPTNEWPAMECSTDQYLSSRYVEDGSYLRISNIALSYNIPLSRSSKVVKHILVNANVGDVFVFSKYSGYNATSNSFGTNVKKMGVDLNSAPLPRSFTLGVKLTF